MQSLIGQTLGKYEILDLIGQGGMATVFKARHADLNRFVAVKVLPPHLAETPGFSQRFKQEAQTIAQLEQHQNILPIYDYGQQDQYSYLVMRYIEGSTSLVQAMQSRVTYDQIIHYLRQVGSALDYAHQRNIVHRDVKPSNILLDQDWVFLADFGLARIMKDAVRLTQTNMGIGTPAYMSPEQSTDGPIDGRTDVYAVGVIAFQMFTGEIPHDSDTPHAITYKRLHEPLPSMTAINTNLPETVEQRVNTALAVAPADRYPTTGAFVTALDEAISQANIDRTRPVRLASSESVPVANTQTPTVFSPSPAQERPRRFEDARPSTPVDVSSPPIPQSTPSPNNPTVVAAQAPMPSQIEPASAPTPEPQPNRSRSQAFLWGCVGSVMVIALFGVAGWFMGQVLWDASSAEPTLDLASLVTSTPTEAVVESTNTPVPQIVNPTPILPTATPTPRPTATPLGQNCPASPQGTFAIFWEKHRDQLGCPVSEEVIIPTIAEEAFAGGHMFWRSDTDEVYIVYDENNITAGEWELNPVDRKWDGSDPDGLGLTAPPGFVEPKRGFGWLWRTHLGGPDSRLGWALDKEYGFDNLGQAQQFQAGRMFKASGPRLYVLLNDGQFFAR